MAGFHVVWLLALAMVAYADVVDGGCRGGIRLLGPVKDEMPGAAGEVRPGFDAWLDALRRWRQWSGGRAVVGGVDGLGPVSPPSQSR
jgi:hypothetical protein